MWSYWLPLSGWLFLIVVFICHLLLMLVVCPLGSVMKWCSRQVIIISLPSVVDCCLFYFVVCCCMLLHIVLYCCMLLFVVAWLMRCSKWILIIQWCNNNDGCWMLKQWMMHVDDACWWCMSMMTMPCVIPCILTQIVSIIMVRLLQWMMKNDNVGEQWFYGDKRRTILYIVDIGGRQLIVVYNDVHPPPPCTKEYVPNESTSRIWLIWDEIVPFSTFSRQQTYCSTHMSTPYELTSMIWNL